MIIHFHKKFTKKYKLLPEKIKNAVDEKIKIFTLNPFDPQLNNHKLHGEYEGQRSIKITGDYRAHYKQLSKTEIIFFIVGTHPELYE